MHRSTRAWVLLGVVLAAVGVSVLVAAFASAGEPEEETRRSQIQWQLVQAGPGGRSLDVSFSYGGCATEPRGSAEETAAGIRLTVTVAQPPPSSTKACPAIARLVPSFPIALKAPLSGRRILGSWSGAVSLPNAARRVPRLVGLAPTDARRLLSTALPAVHLREHASAHAPVPRAVVRTQYPAPGALIPNDHLLRVRIARP